jgi:hypothetical protein
MPQVTMGFDVFCCASPELEKKVKKGNAISHVLHSCHMWQGYADARAGAGKGALWRISFPYLTWARGLGEGGILPSPTNPGNSFIVDESFLVRNYNQIAFRRIW